MRSAGAGSASGRALARYRWAAAAAAARSGPVLTSLEAGAPQNITYAGNSACGRLTLCSVFVLLMATGSAHGAGLNVVAAENFYGDAGKPARRPVCQRGEHRTHPDQDPHRSRPAPRSAANCPAPEIWWKARGLLPVDGKAAEAAKSPERQVIVVADLAGKKADNPHIWDDTSIMAKYADALSAALVQDDPDHRAQHQAAPKRRCGVFAGADQPEDRRYARPLRRPAGHCHRAGLVTRSASRICCGLSGFAIVRELCMLKMGGK